MSSLLISSAVRSNLFSLRQTNELMGVVQQRIATGKRVNSPLDGPSAFFTASSLTSRAGDLEGLLDGIGNAKRVLDSASSGIEAVRSLVESAKSLANQALQTPASNAVVTGTVASLTATTAITATAGGTITVSDGTTTATYTQAAGNDVQDLLDAVNNTANLAVEASLTSDGRIEFEALGTNSVIVGGTTTVAEKAAIGLVAATTTGTLNTARQTLAQEFDTLRTQIDQAAKDAGFNGVNLLDGGDLSIAFNESGTSELNISGFEVSATNLGITTASSGAGQDFQSATEINAFLGTLDSALTTLETQTATLGASAAVIDSREIFTQSMVDTLKAGADDLVAADLNEESAVLLALQSRQQIATTALSFVTQADLNVLRLLQ